MADLLLKEKLQTAENKEVRDVATIRVARFGFKTKRNGLTFPS